MERFRGGAVWSLRVILKDGNGSPERRWTACETLKVFSESLNIVQQTRLRWKKIDFVVDYGKPLGSHLSFFSRSNKGSLEVASI